MLIPIYAHPTHTGYYMGQLDGIVTVAGEPQACQVIAFNAVTLQITNTAISLPNGRYWLNNLDPNKQYLLMARDNLRVARGDDIRAVRDYEPFCYDDVYPANTLTLNEQMALWQQWVTESQ